MDLFSWLQKSQDSVQNGLHIHWSKWLAHNGDTLSKKFDYRSADKTSFELSIETHFSFQRGIMDQTFFIMEHSKNIGFTSGFYICQFTLDDTTSKKTVPSGNTVTLKTEAYEDGRVLFTTTDDEASNNIRQWFSTGEDLLMRIFGPPIELILMLPVPNDCDFQKQHKAIMKSLPERDIETVITDLMR